LILAKKNYSCSLAWSLRWGYIIFHDRRLLVWSFTLGSTRDNQSNAQTSLQSIA
jgi:hypothetical protein